MVWCAYPTDIPVQKERATCWPVLGNVGKMGTQALWCFPNCFTDDHSRADIMSYTASSIEEFEYEGHTLAQAPHKRVPLGPEFQAQLPSKVFPNSKSAEKFACEADSLCWLGERVWPKQEANLSTLEEFSLRAHGHECSCIPPDTLECVKLHIKERREALKVELREAFYSWGFDEMGETVAERWTDEEQLTFQELVRKNPVSFWHSLSESFPSKCMADLVSFYFNVFVLRKRAIQNRVTPDNIDSDDDEMVLDSDEGDSESMLESNEEEQQSQVDDAASDEEQDGSVSWSVKDDAAYEKSPGNAGSKGDVKTTGKEEYDESASRADCTQYRRGSLLKDPASDDCCGSSNENDKNQALKSWELLAWDHKNHMNPSGCVIGQSDTEAWSSASLRATQDEVDKLISTKGMMEEFFGSEVCERPK